MGGSRRALIALRGNCCAEFARACNLTVRTAFGAAASIALSMLVWGGLTAATAQDSPRGILGLGNAVVSGFSGVRPPAAALPPGIDPVEKTFIDLDRASARVINVDALLGPPQGQLVAAPKPFTLTAAQIGQVFAVALDDAAPPNIYLAATSAYGLPIVVPDHDGDGQPDRARRGGPYANFMPGLFGPLTANGGPGSIWKIDGRTGAVALFANVTLDGAPNSGPALGGLAFDRTTRQLFVADRDTGMIHRFGLDGADRGRFDHGADALPVVGSPPLRFDPRKRLDPTSPAFDSGNSASWGYAPPERRIFGLAVRDGRLFYAVAAGPQVWSVSIVPDGRFGSDPRLELNVPRGKGAAEISKIVFDADGRMIVAERGAPTGGYDYKALTEAGESRVLRFRLKRPGDPPGPGLWHPTPEEYAIGFAPDFRNGNGGIAIGYGSDAGGNINRSACGGTLWSTGGQLRNAREPATVQRLQPGGPLIVDGLQGNAIDLVRPQSEPPFASYHIDFDDRFEDTAARGHLGDVEIWRMCPAAVVAAAAPLACPPGTLDVGGVCLFPLACPQGTEFADGRCVYPGCPASYVRIGSQCVPPPLNCKANETYWGGGCEPQKCQSGLVQLIEDWNLGPIVGRPGKAIDFDGGYCKCPAGQTVGKDGSCGPSDCTGNNSGYWGSDPNCGTPPPTNDGCSWYERYIARTCGEKPGRPPFTTIFCQPPLIASGGTCCLPSAIDAGTCGEKPGRPPFTTIFCQPPLIASGGTCCLPSAIDAGTCGTPQTGPGASCPGNFRNVGGAGADSAICCVNDKVALVCSATAVKTAGGMSCGGGRHPYDPNLCCTGPVANLAPMCGAPSTPVTTTSCTQKELAAGKVFIEGACVCQPGTKLNAKTGKCEKTGGQNTPTAACTQKELAAGKVFMEGACVCQPGTKLNAKTGKCEKTGGQTPPALTTSACTQQQIAAGRISSGGSCICPPGTSLKSGRCEKTSAQKPCDTGFHRDESGRCVRNSQLQGILPGLNIGIGGNRGSSAPRPSTPPPKPKFN